MLRDRATFVSFENVVSIIYLGPIVDGRHLIYLPMAIACNVCEIFAFKPYCDLETGSGSLKVIESGTDSDAM